MNLIKVFVLAVFSCSPLFSNPQLESVFPPLELSGDQGGRLDGTSWSNKDFLGKLQLIFYVDPDEADVNDPAAERLRSEGFPRDRIQSIAIINFAATWIPNALISKKLKSKQKKFPTTVYVRDLKKSLVEKWGYNDDASVVSLLDGTGKLVFYRAGKLSEEDILKVIGEIRGRIEGKG